MGGAARIGCYPGSFNPPTVAHLAVASAARASCGLDRVDLVVSRVALGKSAAAVPSFEDRVAVLAAVVASRSEWLGLVVSDAQLLVDLSAGYDVLVIGADKWAQVLDPAFYGGSPSRRDDAVASLPALAVAPRGGVVADGLPGSAVVLDVPAFAADVSSTSVRSEGRADWMLPEAAAFDGLSGAWTDPVRYAAWSAARPL